MIKALNYDLRATNEKRILDLHELEKLIFKAYEKAKLYKEKNEKKNDITNSLDGRNFWLKTLCYFDKAQIHILFIRVNLMSLLTFTAFNVGSQT
jgi:hypothetical protein